MRASGALRGNADAQFQAVMAEVAKLNDLGELDEANDLLDAEERQMFEAHHAEKERQEEAERQMLGQRLNQDRLRNDPAAAADRLIRNLRRQAPPGGVFRATRDLLVEWVVLTDAPIGATARIDEGHAGEGLQPGGFCKVAADAALDPGCPEGAEKPGLVLNDRPAYRRIELFDG